MAVKKGINEKEVAEQPVKKQRSPLFLLFLIALGAVVTGALVMGLVLYFIGIPGVAPKVKPQAAPVYETVEMGERVINLDDSDGARYLRVRIVLEHKKNEKLAAEIKTKEAAIMDSILHTLRSKKVDDIRPLEKEEKVKAEILNAVNAKLESGKIERVYFTDFLIQ
ncbi:MAG: flagellar basal body-associated FliL family protein [Peptococcaceae bacterium]|nr:flagellar basal body-associated FliL family protein [Peptococcaceae bacterium]